MFARRTAAAISLLAMAAALSPVRAADGDPAKGKRNYGQCRACHSLDKGRNLAGPSLHCIVGRRAAAASGYRYSKSLKALGDKGYTWDDAGLFVYLQDPRDFLKKRLGVKRVSNRMFNRYRNETFRRDVIAYLKAEACR